MCCQLQLSSRECMHHADEGGCEEPREADGRGHEAPVPAHWPEAGHGLPQVCVQWVSGAATAEDMHAHASTCLMLYHDHEQSQQSITVGTSLSGKDF